MTHPIVRVVDLVPGETVPVASVDAETLTAESFWTEHVIPHRPVLIRGAVKHWAAVQKWSDPRYLISDLKKDVFFSRTHNPFQDVVYGRVIRRQSLQRCLDTVRDAAPEETWSVPSFDVPESWSRDLGPYPFLPPEHDRFPVFYERQRLFLYRNAATDWHPHLLDETLTTQLVGSKRIGLFKLDTRNCEPYAQALEANFHHVANAQHFFPEDARVTKHEGIIHAGDAMYIPPLWWHGIDPTDGAWGLTLAHVFRSPNVSMGYWSDPLTRWTVNHLVKSGNALGAAVASRWITVGSVARAWSKSPFARG